MATLRHMFRCSFPYAKSDGLQLHSVLNYGFNRHSSFSKLYRLNYLHRRGIQTVLSVSEHGRRILLPSQNFRSETLGVGVFMQIKTTALSETKSIIDEKYKERPIETASEESPVSSNKDPTSDKQAKKELKFLGIALWKWGIAWLTAVSIPIVHELYFVRGTRFLILFRLACCCFGICNSDYVTVKVLSKAIRRQLKTSSAIYSELKFYVGYRQSFECNC